MPNIHSKSLSPSPLACSSRVGRNSSLSPGGKVVGDSAQFLVILVSADRVPSRKRRCRPRTKRSLAVAELVEEAGMAS